MSMSVGKWALAVLAAGLIIFVVVLLISLLASNDVLLRFGIVLAGITTVSALVLGLFGWKETAGKIAVAGAIVAILLGLMFFPVTRSGEQPEPEISPQRVGISL